MNTPTSTFINLPTDFLTNVFNIVGYLFNNFNPILVIVFGFAVFVAIFALVISLFKRD
jgi:divalent metal cation (Fe/Co/Zn/Cd) transporter